MLICIKTKTTPYLKMWTRYAFRYLPKERFLDTSELGRFYDVQYLLDFAEEHDLLLATRLRPVLEEAANDRLRQVGVLFEKLHHAVGELRVIQRQALDLVQWYKHLDEELLVLRLQRQSEPVYYRP